MPLNEQIPEDEIIFQALTLFTEGAATYKRIALACKLTGKSFEELKAIAVEKLSLHMPKDEGEFHLIQAEYWKHRGQDLFDKNMTTAAVSCIVKYEEHTLQYMNMRTNGTLLGVRPSMANLQVEIAKFLSGVAVKYGIDLTGKPQVQNFIDQTLEGED